MSQFFISCKESKIENNRSFYGCFHLGPFEPSQSITIANALRRTLLSELFGLSIVSVEIEGATHEYSNINGVKDSVLDILLNLKEIIFKKDSKGIVSPLNRSTIPFLSQELLGKPQIGYLKARGPGLIRASNLRLPPFIQCVDPDQYIATLAEDGFLNMKFVIQYGNKWIKPFSGTENFYTKGTASHPGGLSHSGKGKFPCLLQPPGFSKAKKNKTGLAWGPSSLSSFFVCSPDAQSEVVKKGALEGIFSPGDIFAGDGRPFFLAFAEEKKRTLQIAMHKDIVSPSGGNNRKGLPLMSRSSMLRTFYYDNMLGCYNKKFGKFLAYYTAACSEAGKNMKNNKVQERCSVATPNCKKIKMTPLSPRRAPSGRKRGHFYGLKEHGKKLILKTRQGGVPRGEGSIGRLLFSSVLPSVFFSTRTVIECGSLEATALDGTYVEDTGPNLPRRAPSGSLKKKDLSKLKRKQRQAIAPWPVVAEQEPASLLPVRKDKSLPPEYTGPVGTGSDPFFLTSLGALREKKCAYTYAHFFARPGAVAPGRFLGAEGDAMEYSVLSRFTSCFPVRCRYILRRVSKILKKEKLENTTGLTSRESKRHCYRVRQIPFFFSRYLHPSQKKMWDYANTTKGNLYQGFFFFGKSRSLSNEATHNTPILTWNKSRCKKKERIEGKKKGKETKIISPFCRVDPTWQSCKYSFFSGVPNEVRKKVHEQAAQLPRTSKTSQPGVAAQKRIGPVLRSNNEPAGCYSPGRFLPGRPATTMRSLGSVAPSFHHLYGAPSFHHLYEAPSFFPASLHLRYGGPCRMCRKCQKCLQGTQQKNRVDRVQAKLKIRTKLERSGPKLRSKNEPAEVAEQKRTGSFLLRNFGRFVFAPQLRAGRPGRSGVAPKGPFVAELKKEKERRIPMPLFFVGRRPTPESDRLITIRAGLPHPVLFGPDEKSHSMVSPSGPQTILDKTKLERRGKQRSIGRECLCPDPKSYSTSHFSRLEYKKRLDLDLFFSSNPLTIEAVFNPITKVNYIIEINDYKTTQTSFETSFDTLELFNILNQSPISDIKTKKTKNKSESFTPHLISNLQSLIPPKGQPSRRGSEAKKKDKTKGSSSDQEKSLALTKEITKHNIIFEIWTNGSIHPRDAIYEGFKNLVKLFSKLNKINTFMI